MDKLVQVVGCPKCCNETLDFIRAKKFLEQLTLFHGVSCLLIAVKIYPMVYSSR